MFLKSLFAFNPHYPPPLRPEVPGPEGKKKGGQFPKRKEAAVTIKKKEGDT